MLIYRIAKTEKRARDLSGTGSYIYGGRWNSKGTYMVYACDNSSLAFLENLVHQDESELPPQLDIAVLRLEEAATILTVPDSEYPNNWQKLENIRNKLLGDEWMYKKQWLGFKLRSAINPTEYNYLLNPLFPGYHELVRIESLSPLEVDKRLVKR
jgi:RES domain-containing protein